MKALLNRLSGRTYWRHHYQKKYQQDLLTRIEQILKNYNAHVIYTDHFKLDNMVLTEPLLVIAKVAVIANSKYTKKPDINRMKRARIAPVKVRVK